MNEEYRGYIIPVRKNIEFDVFVDGSISLLSDPNRKIKGDLELIITANVNGKEHWADKDPLNLTGDEILEFLKRIKEGKIEVKGQRDAENTYTIRLLNLNISKVNRKNQKNEIGAAVYHEDDRFVAISPLLIIGWGKTENSARRNFKRILKYYNLCSGMVITPESTMGDYLTAMTWRSLGAPFMP